MSSAASRLLWIGFCAFVALLTASVVSLVWLRPSADEALSGYAVAGVLPALAGAFLVVFLLRRRIIVYSYVIAILLAGYGTQEYLLRSGKSHRPGGDKLQVVRQARAAGLDAVPSMHPLRYLWDDIPLPEAGGKPVLPLAGISTAHTVYCQEAGEFVSYVSDRYGFNNPDRAWDGPVEIAFVGDSFTQGACVPAAEHFTGKLRREFPGLLNLGIGGNGPLMAFAAFREYLVDVRPRHLFWLYFEGNDIGVRPAPGRDSTSDLDEELTLDVLRAYLADPGFRQGLKDYQREIDASLRALADSSFTAELKRRADSAPAPRSSSSALAKRLIFWPLAKRIANGAAVERLRTTRGLQASPLQGAATDEASHEGAIPAEEGDRRLSIIACMLARMQSALEGWGGTLHLVYLPEVSHFRYGPHPLRNAVLVMAAEQGVNLIDMVPVFETERDPLRVFALGERGGHYNARGYALIASSVREAVMHARDPGPRSQNRLSGAPCTHLSGGLDTASTHSRAAGA